MNYRINQFHVQSEVPLPCDLLDSRHVANNHVPASLRIQRSSFIDSVREVHWTGRRSWARSYDVGTGVMICVESRARFLIDKQASHVLVSHDEADAYSSRLVGACLINLGMSVCSLLRGDLALHGAAVERHGEALVIMAPSGTGKSTLLWALRGAGFRFVSDDVLMVQVSEKTGRIMAVPAFGLHSKLDNEGLLRHNLEADSHLEVLPNTGEYWMPVPAEQRVFHPLPLGGILILHPSSISSPFGTRVTFNRQSPGSALSHLMENIQGLWAVHNLAPAHTLFTNIKHVVRNVPVHVINYPKTYESLPLLASGIKALQDGAVQNAPVQLQRSFHAGMMGKVLIRAK